MQGRGIVLADLFCGGFDRWMLEGVRYISYQGGWRVLLASTHSIPLQITQRTLMKQVFAHPPVVI